MKKHSITHRLVLKAELKSESPMRIANGKGDRADLILLRDHRGRPYIPGSSIAGAIRDRWDRTQFEEQLPKATLNAFWGTETQSEKPGHIFQSHFRVQDLPIQGRFQTLVRDGVRIDRKLGTVEDSKKYDSEILERGVRFAFQAEITVRAGMDPDGFRQMAAWTGKTLQNELQVGGNTSKGFGLLKCEDFKVWEFDFSQPDAAKGWLDFCAKGSLDHAFRLPEDFAQAPAELAPADLEVKATFSLRSSLIIGGPGKKDEFEDEEKEVKKFHLHSGGQPVISGSSLMGALRHRAEKILKVAGVSGSDGKINHLFGYQGDDGDATKIQRSRIDTREASIHAKSAVQTRIRLDRFTQAPVEGGLFNSAPVWRVHQEDDSGKVTLWWRIRDYQPGEAALLLHLLRDLWTGDLPLGGEKNIGRGRLEGFVAEVSFPNQPAVQIKQQEEGIELTDPNQLLSQFNQPLSQLFTPAT